MHSDSVTQTSQLDTFTTVLIKTSQDGKDRKGSTMTIFIQCIMCLLFIAVQYVSPWDNQIYSSTLTKEKKCPIWQQKDKTGNCVCDFDLANTVICKERPYSLQLLSCYCMTSNSEGNKILVGSCQYTCQRTEKGYVYYFPIHANTSSQLNEFMCSRYNRQGQLCGSCESGHAPPVYSYSLSCINCSTSNWAKYTAVSLLPVTAFFAFVIIFRISATSPKLNGYILSTQILSSPPNMKALFMAHPPLPVKVMVSALFSIWNLDFFRLVYTPFCLQSHTNSLQVMALDYIIAVYPLILTALFYLLVILYDHNVRIIVRIGKPFVSLFIRFRRQWNIRSSLVDAFATFLLLSYIKILSVSVDLLMPVLVYDQNGDRLPQLYLFNQGDVVFLGTQHLSTPPLCLSGPLLSPHLHTATNASAFPLPLLLFPGLSQPHWLQMSAFAHFHGHIPGTLQRRHQWHT